MARVSMPFMWSAWQWERKNWSAAATFPSLWMLSNLSMTLGSCVKAIDDALNVVQDLIPITADPRKGCELSHETAHGDQVGKKTLEITAKPHQRSHSLASIFA